MKTRHLGILGLILIAIISHDCNITLSSPSFICWKWLSKGDFSVKLFIMHNIQNLSKEYYVIQRLDSHSKLLQRCDWLQHWCVTVLVAVLGTTKANVCPQDKVFTVYCFCVLIGCISRISIYFVSSRYIPPLLWGKSGHLQTALYGKLGRVSSPHPKGIRKYLPMQDGATATFDLFEPLGDHRTRGNEFDQDTVCIVGCCCSDRIY